MFSFSVMFLIFQNTCGTYASNYILYNVCNELIQVNLNTQFKIYMFHSIIKEAITFCLSFLFGCLIRMEPPHMNGTLVGGESVLLLDQFLIVGHT